MHETVHLDRSGGSEGRDDGRVGDDRNHLRLSLSFNPGIGR